MTRNLAKVVQLTASLRKLPMRQEDRDHLLREVIITLADEVVHLTRELETVRSTAQRAERQSRMFAGVRR